jgi:serine/threonine-protein kinase
MQQIPPFPTAQLSQAQAAKPRCRLAGAKGSDGKFTHEVECLLRHRLRLAVLIMLTGFVFFLVNAFLHGPQSLILPRCGVELEAGVTGLLAVCALILWTRWPLTIGALHVSELVIFGAAAAFFAWSQHIWFRDEMARRLAAPGAEEAVNRLGNALAGLRWCVLIVVYGTFIPNTWRRGALTIGVMALIPITLILARAAVADNPRFYLGELLPDAVILMVISCTTAVFGTYKLRSLHEEVFEARKLGQYRLKQLLGEGGMGQVWLAEHVMLRRPCAIKLIRSEKAGDANTLARFEREVQTMATLTHWNTVEIFDYGHTEDGTFYYVMEYLPGMSLEDLVESYGVVPPERVVHLLRQVCQALREAHAIGLIHRDIKAGNIIACERGKVYDLAKLLDFGLVKDVASARGAANLTLDGVVTGTPAYMSPEQALGETRLDARTDIYSLGSVAYFLLTGRLPFERDTPMKMLLAHARDRVTPLTALQADVPADLQGVILRCLEKEPAERFQDAESLESALATCECAGQWTQADAATWWQKHAERSLPRASVASTDRDVATILHQ